MQLMVRRQARMRYEHQTKITHSRPRRRRCYLYAALREPIFLSFWVVQVARVEETTVESHCKPFVIRFGSASSHHVCVRGAYIDLIYFCAA